MAVAVVIFLAGPSPAHADAPNVSQVTVASSSATAATATVTVTAAGTFHVRFSPSGEDQWTTLSSQTAAAAGNLTFSLTGLTGNAYYDVEVSESSTFDSGVESATFQNRPAHLDFSVGGTDAARGIAGTSSTLWVATEREDATAKYLAFTRNPSGQHGQRVPSKDITGASTNIWSVGTNDDPGGLWTDGTYLYAVERAEAWTRGRVWVYRLSDGARQQRREISLDHEHYNPKGIWVDDDILGDDGAYFVLGGNKEIWSYWRTGDHRDGDRNSRADFNVHPVGSFSMNGIWSDGQVLWAVHGVDQVMYASDPRTGRALPALNIQMSTDHSGCFNDRGPGGLWGDGQYLWVTDTPQTGAPTVYAYYQPSPSTSVAGVSVKSATSSAVTIRAHTIAPDTSKTVYLRYREPFAASWSSLESATVGQTVDFSISGAASASRLVVQASLDSTFADGTEVTELLVVRPGQHDVEFTFGDGKIRGIATDGLHMFELEEDAWGVWVRAYRMSNNNLVGLRTFRIFEREVEPGGLHLEVTTARPDDDEANDAGDDRVPGYDLWLIDQEGLVRVWKGDAGAFGPSSRHLRDVSLDTDHVSGLRGGWSDGTTLYAVGHNREHIYAFDVSNARTTGARQSTKEGSLATDYGQPRGMWSDDSTLWVVDGARNRIYAYELSSSGVGDRTPLLEIKLARENANPWGLTSHGGTLYVADATKRKAFAYSVPAAPSGDITNVEFTSVGLTSATVKVTIVNEDSTSKTVALRYMVAPNGAVQSSSTTTSGTTATFSLTGLSAGTHYMVAAKVDSAAEIVTPGFQTRSRSEERAHFLKNTVVPEFEGSYPWVRGEYDQMREENVEIRAIPASVPSEVFLNCIRRPVLEMGGCELIRMDISDASATKKSTYLHELGHFFSAGAWNAAGDNGGRGIAWLYFYKLADEGTDCTFHELYADAIMAATMPGSTTGYYAQCSNTGDSPSAATLALVRSVLANEIPTWFDDNYQFGMDETALYDTAALDAYSQSYDLEEFWDDLFDLTKWRFAAVTAMRDAFGGYCANKIADHAADNQDYLDNPWRAGGCLPQAPTVTLDTDGTATWTAPSYDGGSHIREYIVEWKNPGQDYDASRRAKVDADETLTYDTTSTAGGSSVRVRAVTLLDDVTGYHTAKRWGEAEQPPTAPAKPNRPILQVRHAALGVDWRAPSDGGSPITSYDLRHIESDAMDKSDSEWTEVVGIWTTGGGALWFELDNLTNGTQYDVQVRAVNTAGTGEWSDTRSATPVSSDNKLSQLSLSEGWLSPGFDGEVTAYTVSVGYTVTELTLTSMLSDERATLGPITPADADAADDGHQVSLSPGNNQVTIRVTAENGTRRNYQLTVHRAAPDTVLSPRASDPSAPFASEAVYTATFQGMWSASVTPDGVPAGAHFSRLVGAIHSDDVTFLTAGASASSGVESMAEEGLTTILKSEIQTAIDAMTAREILEGSSTIAATSSATLNPTLTSVYPRITLLTMIAPSPDWFVGVSGLPLTNNSGRWIRSRTVNLYAWDAGTEDGSTFSMSNDATDPPGTIASINGTRPFSTEPVATLRLDLQSISTTRSVAENTPTGAALGAPVTAAAATNPVSYTLTGSDRASFTITSSGQLRTKTALDFEQQDSYVVEVTLTDPSGSLDTTVFIDVTNVREIGSLTLSSRQPQVDSVLTATLTDPDVVSSVDWSWERSTSRSSGWQSISAATGASYTPTATDESYYLRVTATYTDGFAAGEVLSTISDNPVQPVPPVNTAPTFASSSTTRSVPENSPPRTAVGQPVTATDLEDSTLTYSLSGADASSFTIDAATGQIRVAPGAQLDHEHTDRLSVVVTASDPSNLEGSISVTIDVTDVNEPPDAADDLIEVLEDTPHTIDVLANDSDPEDALSDLTVLVGLARNGRAVVNTPQNPGDIPTIEYTPRANYHGLDSFTYRVRDSGNLTSAAASVSITIHPLNDAPEFASATAERRVAEAAQEGDAVGAPVTATDIEGDTLSYSLSGADAFAFDIDDDGQITVGVGTTFEITTQDTYEVTVTATDSGSPPESATIDVTITVTTGPVTPPSFIPVGIGIGIGIGGGGGPSGPESSDEDFEWTVEHDIEELDEAHDTASGAWTVDGTLLLLQNGQGTDDAVYAYDLETGERVEDAEFELANQNRAPRGVWSDGVTVWVSDSGQDKLFAYDLATGERLPDRDIVLDDENRDARGIWSDGETVWVLNRNPSLFGYDLETGALLGEYELADENSSPHGLWSDGVTLWVSNHNPKRLFAYRLPVLPDEPPEDPPALERVSAEDFEEPGRVGNNSPRGIWSDGDVMYVADEHDNKVYSYNMPDAIDARLASLELSGVEFGEFSAARREYEGVPAADVTSTVVEAQAVHAGAAVAIAPGDADAEAEGHQVALAGVEEIVVTVTSADGSRERTYRVRLPEEEAGPSASCLRGVVGVGFSLVVYEGGSVDDLVACAEHRHITALYVLAGGEWVSYIAAAPDFVNAEFRELFAEGVPALTPLTVRSEGPATPAPEAPAVSEPFAACLIGEVADGFSLVVSEGGSVDELVTCVEGLGVTAVYALDGGEWVSYILAAPDFVNARFRELFAEGVPALTPLTVKGSGP